MTRQGDSGGWDDWSAPDGAVDGGGVDAWADGQVGGGAVRRQAAGPVTHRIVKASARPLTLAAEADVDDDDGEDFPLTWREVLDQAADRVRFYDRSPGSLRAQVRYARDGAYSNRSDGLWRKLNIGYSYIAVAGLSVCYFLGWALFTRLSRVLTCAPLLLAVLMLANRVPIVQWVVPDWIDFTTWWPFSLFVGEG